MGLDHGTQAMIQGEVKLLHFVGLSRGHGNQHVAPARHFPAALASQPDCGQPHGPRYAQRRPDVFRISRCADTQEDVSGPAMPVDGLRIGVIGLNVVAKGAEKRASRGDVDRRERSLEGAGQGRPHLGINLSQALSDLLRQGPPAQVSLHQLADNMVAVGRAPAVSADKELAAAREAPDEKLKRFFYLISADGERRIPSQQLLQVTLHDGECSIRM